MTSPIIVPGAGRTPCPIIFIGEAPGEVEASQERYGGGRRNEPFIGPSGQEQDLYLSRFNYCARQFYRTNLVKLYLPGNPDPSPALIDSWRPALRAELIACRPRLIVTVGAYATWEFLRTSDSLSPEPYFLTGKVHGIPHYTSSLSVHADLFDVFGEHYIGPDNLDPDLYPIVIPVIHPAAGMRSNDESLALRSKIYWDYSQVCAAIDLILAGKSVSVVADHYVGQEDYRVISPRDLPTYLPFYPAIREIAIDTEGEPGKAFSLQFSISPGTGYMLLIDDPEYAIIAAPYLQAVINSGVPVLIHSRYELEMARDIRLDFSRANIIDTMYLAYPLLVEPQGLKELCHRNCGMSMASHEEIVKPIGQARQISYLQEVVRRANLATIDLSAIRKPKTKGVKLADVRKRAANIITDQLSCAGLYAIPLPPASPKTITVSEWPIPPRRQVLENDGTLHDYKPQPIAKTAKRILDSIQADRVDDIDPDEKDEKDARKDNDSIGVSTIVTDEIPGDPTPPSVLVNARKRWHNISKKYRGVSSELRTPVESALGRFPYGSVRGLYESGEEGRAIATRYACRDADATLRWRQSAIPKLSNFHGHDLTPLTVQGSYLSTVIDEMQGRGVPIHLPSLRQLASDLESSLRTIGALISYQFWDSQPFNPNSSDQVQLLMEKRRLEGGKRTADGGWSTAKSSIEGLRYTDPAMAMVFDWREHEHTLSAFIYPVLDSIPANYPHDLWRVHGRIKNTRTTSRRFSASKADDGTGTNLLAWPKHSKFGKSLRACCRAPEGFKFLTADYKQIEVRGMAHKSGDRRMIEIICRRAEDGYSEIDRDFHTQTAAFLFGVRPEDVKEDTQRTPAKRITFGVGYGLRGFGLAAQLQSFGITGWPADRCDEYITEWFKLYSGYRTYNDQCEREARQYGLCFDDWGMPRYLPGAWSRDRKIAAESCRHYVSHKIQGWAQGVIQNSMWALKPIVLDWQQVMHKEIYWLLQEHDALDFECKEEEIEMVRAVVPYVMTTAHGVKNCRVPIEVDVKVTQAWGAKS